jgi:hypothetical protein
MQHSKRMRLVIIKPGVISTATVPYSLVHVQGLQYDKLPAIQFSDAGYTKYYKMSFICSTEKLIFPAQTFALCPSTNVRGSNIYIKITSRFMKRVQILWAVSSNRTNNMGPT